MKIDSITPEIKETESNQLLDRIRNDFLGLNTKYRIANGYALRNTQLGNLLACCALTLPVRCSPTPAGLMIMAPSGEDDRLLRVGKAIESTIGFVRGGQV